MSLRAIDEWCDAETRFWTDVYAGSRDFEAEFIRLNEVSPTIFLFEISHDRVTIRNKPGYEINQGRVSGEGQPAMRARHYHQFFESCLTLSGQKMQTTLAVDVHDLAVTRSSGPLFCFQKKTGDVNILLPDIDFMQNGWYVNRHREPEFDAKRLEATFIGSSTGGGILSALDIAQARPERLRLARELVGHPRIKFLIGAAVQCDSEQTARLLQQQPYYTRPVPWENQLQSRFLLSVDGNGATCSRVVKALSSGSILLKMASENQLYYFHGLEPWRHYIPVRSISDIEYVIERAPRLQLSKMIAQANEFVTNALSVEAVHDYGAKLLARYAKQIFGTLVEPPKPSPAQTSTSIIPIALTVHADTLGDIVAAGGWAGDLQKRRMLQGIEIASTPVLADMALMYRCLVQNGQWSDWVSPGAYSGTRGLALAITGLEISISPTDPLDPSLRVFLLFADGTIQILTGTGMLQSATKQPITAVKMILVRHDVILGVPSSRLLSGGP